ncbi:MAG: ATP-binding protein [Cyanobacteria bacterium J06634_5]
MVTRKEAFQKAYSNLNLSPLVEERALAEFWVEYGADVIDDLEQLIEDDDTEDGKTIFAGHRGCGKSTLLAQFAKNCEQQGFFVVSFSIADTIEMSDVNYINVLFAIAVNMMESAEIRDVTISASAKKAFKEWFAVKTQTNIQEASAEGEVKFNLFTIIKNNLKVSSKVRNELKLEFEPKVSELVMQINAIAAAIQNASDKKILVIIDDLDKLDLGVVRELYGDHIKTLFSPGFRIIYTTPMASLRNKALQATMITESDNQIVEMPVMKLYKQRDFREDDVVSIPKNHDLLCRLLNKRVPSELIDSGIANKLVLKSGGVLRELIRLTNRCCRICLRRVRRERDPDAVKIDEAVFEQAVKDIRLDFEVPLGKADYEILKQTYEKFEPLDPKDQTFLDLLHGLYALEYRNGEVWYDLHPVVKDLLVLKGVLGEEQAA